MIDVYVMIWHLKILNLKTILRPSIVKVMPLKRSHVVPSLHIKCTPRVPLPLILWQWFRYIMISSSSYMASLEGFKVKIRGGS